MKIILIINLVIVFCMVLIPLKGHAETFLTEQQARNIICEILEITPPCPDEMLSTIATIKLNFENFSNLSIYESDPIHIELLEKYNIQVPVWYWPNPEGRYIRISAQLYNHLEEYEYLALALKNVCQN